jgi:hypothetical protein
MDHFKGVRPIVAKRLGKVQSYLDPLENAVDLRLALARHDVGIRQRLQSLGKHGPDLTQLFKLYEDMAKTGKWDDARIDAEGNAPQPTAERFRASANNPAVSGAHSRHGGPGSKLPKATPVTAQEAAPVLLLAYRKYLLDRASSINLRSLL